MSLADNVREIADRERRAASRLTAGRGGRGGRGGGPRYRQGGATWSYITPQPRPRPPPQAPRPRADDRDYTVGLFPTEDDLTGRRARTAAVPGIRPQGSYSSGRQLLDTHVALLSEDFLLAVCEQLNEIRANPGLLDTCTHYAVEGARVLTKDYGRQRRQVAVVMHFDAAKYHHLKWEEERRLMSGNMVFLARDSGALIQPLAVGVVHESKLHDLRNGRVAIKLVSGVDGDGNFKLCNQEDFVGRRFHLIESAAFYFPYLHVTNALRADRQRCGALDAFCSEMVAGSFPSPAPPYLSRVATHAAAEAERIRERFRAELNESQWDALQSVLAHRVALVQGPPGTGKTYLGCKIVQYFVEFKRLMPSILTGPIFVVTTTNHAVHEFLTRCTKFTDKIIHGYSDMHEQSQYGSLQKTYDGEKDFASRVALMKSADILAMTTTRAAYMRKSVDKLEVKIVVVEEAGEALEAYILAAIPPTAEHLIQIGDHKQLRPTCSHQPLAASHHLDLSLFERLIANGADCPMLNEQRRMRPAISRLVASIYPRLTNHPSTKGRPTVTGVDLAVPVFFVDHGHHEKKEGKGFINTWEAEMAAQLAHYLLERGYPAEEITILTTYRKQLSLISKSLRALGKGVTNGIRVSTVDNFQGEENHIVILSLVRGDAGATGHIGFLKMENRACVALSRARDGFFILGSLPCLVASGAAVWRHVQDVLTRHGRVGPALPLACPHGKRFLAASADDVRAAEKGCAVCEAVNAARRAEADALRHATALGALEAKVADPRRRSEEADDDGYQWGRLSAPRGDPEEAESLRKLCAKRDRLRREVAALQTAAKEAASWRDSLLALLARGDLDVDADTRQTLEAKLAAADATTSLLDGTLLGRLSLAHR